eukprot:scpid25523/ scgid25390/ 
MGYGKDCKEMPLANNATLVRVHVHHKLLEHYYHSTEYQQIMYFEVTVAFKLPSFLVSNNSSSCNLAMGLLAVDQAQIRYTVDFRLKHARTAGDVMIATE